MGKRWGNYEGGYLKKEYLEDGSLEDLTKQQNEDWVRRWRPKQANLIIKQMRAQEKLEAKARQVCYTCERVKERVVPYWLERCPECVRKYISKRGMENLQITDPRTRMFFCCGCARTKYRSAMLSVMVCIHCLNRLVKKNLKYPEKEKNVRDGFEEAIKASQKKA